MISLILAESALELVPGKLRHHPSVVHHAGKMGKRPSEILLDNSYHFAAMKGIKNELKRGRPDLVHFSILEAVTIPLYRKDRLRLYVHTADDKVISFSQSIRIPKSYHRFAGLMEKLYKEKKVSSNSETLLEIKDQTFCELLRELNPSKTIGFSSRGVAQSYEQAATKIPKDGCVVIGGFQKGDFSDSVSDGIDELYSVGDESLEGHVVVARLLYEYEKTIFM